MRFRPWAKVESYRDTSRKRSAFERSPASRHGETIMLQIKSAANYSAEIAAALATEGGHLSIGRGGFILHYSNGAMLSG